MLVDEGEHDGHGKRSWVRSIVISLSSSSTTLEEESISYSSSSSCSTRRWTSKASAYSHWYEHWGHWCCSIIVAVGMCVADANCVIDWLVGCTVVIWWIMEFVEDVVQEQSGQTTPEPVEWSDKCFWTAERFEHLYGHTEQM